MEAEEPKSSSFINYQYCPPWGLKHFADRRVSLVGKVTSHKGNDRFVMEIDPQRKIEVEVEVKPYQMRYLFSPQQLMALAKRPQYSTLEKYLFPELRRGEDKMSADEWVFVDAEKMEEDQEKRSQESGQCFKKIIASFFRVNQFLEVRGLVVSEGLLSLQDFTDFGDDFDMQNYNHTLCLMISRAERLYY